MTWGDIYLIEFIRMEAISTKYYSYRSMVCALWSEYNNS